MTLNQTPPSVTVSSPPTREWVTVAPYERPSAKLHRGFLVFVGVGLIAALVIARCLTPDPRGFGTHQQLGLPGCTFAHFAGLPCPSCGMTTSWAHLTRGHWRLAAECNLGGLIAGLTAMIAGPWALVSGVRGRWLFGQPRLSLVLTLAIATYLAIVGQWLARLWNN